MFFLLAYFPIQAMDTEGPCIKKHETEERLPRTKEDTVQKMLDHSYLSGNFSFESIDRAPIFVQLRTVINQVSVDNPEKFDNYIALFNTLSAYDKKIKKYDVEAKKDSSFCSKIWYFLPFMKELQIAPRPQIERLPIEQHRILSQLLEKDSSSGLIPDTEKVKAFFESQLKSEEEQTEITSYTWFEKATLQLPTTFSNGLVNLTFSHNATPIDMSPVVDKPVLPTTQFWLHDSEGTHMSDDATATNANMPGKYSAYDATQTHFVGFHEVDDKSIKIFELPRGAREYSVHTKVDEEHVVDGTPAEINVGSIDVKKYTQVSIGKPIITIPVTNTLSALMACQNTKEIVYSVYNEKSSQIYVQKIKQVDGNVSEPISIVVEGTVKHIVELDCFNYICLTSDGLLHRITKKFDVQTKKYVLEKTPLACDARFARIAVDQKTNLCALVQADMDKKDVLYVGDKNLLKDLSTINVETLHKIDAQNPFTEDIKKYRAYESEDFGNLCTIAPKLQCYEGSVVAWYPSVVKMSGQFSKWGNQSLATFLGKYSAIKKFKTQFSV